MSKINRDYLTERIRRVNIGIAEYHTAVTNNLQHEGTSRDAMWLARELIRRDVFSELLDVCDE